ncbi:MAG: ankyrin repeat domain-containing protein [Planctomycetaceae bacterium]|nr:ankyrin repeat domain-containing protein [Planctomycetaceae bacterium]
MAIPEKKQEIISFVRSVLAFDQAELGVDELLYALKRDKKFRSKFANLIKQFLPEELESLCGVIDGPAIVDAADQLQLLPDDPRLLLSESQLQAIAPNDAIEFLCVACIANDVKSVLHFVKVVNPNQLDHNGQLPLTYAVGNNNSECVKILLENKANPNLRQRNGETSMHVCARSIATKELFQLLCSYGGDLDKRDSDGQTVRQRLVEFGRRKWIPRSGS